ncbi:HNH endonuclease signature motif containing protein [Psychrobacillus sp. FSL K6-2836]|uniref:HNH endonuclease n=1 Tax=Psychrobacillus sp. FSL K6-2836 TaxID=2921548 RepID=UPI0030F4DE81
MDIIFRNAEFEDNEIELLINANYSWNQKDPQLEKFKKELYRKLRQNIYCPYCMRRLNRKKKDEIDHIIHKSDYEHFTFQPKNLVIACNRCNNNKLAKNVLEDLYIEEFKNKSWKEYPDSGGIFKIVHPYYDIYKHHINLNEIFYSVHNDSDKGKNTIEMMNLYGFDLLEEKVKHSDSFQKIISSSIGNPDNDRELITWAKFLLEPPVIQETIFDIIINFQKSGSKGEILKEEQYHKLKKKIRENDDTNTVEEFEIEFRASAKYIKTINEINDEEIIEKTIIQLENLYELRDLHKDLNYALLIALILIVRKKEGKYTKRNLSKYLAS